MLGHTFCLPAAPAWCIARHLYEEESSKPDMLLHMGCSTANTSCCEDPSTPDRCTEMTQLPSGSLVSTLGGKPQGTDATDGRSQHQQPGSSNTLHSSTTRHTGAAAGLAGSSNAAGYATVSGLDQEAGHAQIGLEADTVRLVTGEAPVQVTTLTGHAVQHPSVYI